jgi:molecular chaperone DnaJ
VEVPPGIESGQRIRISGAGHAGEVAGRAGDLYVEVLVAEDERFERHGQDLVTILEVSATRAMLGGKATVSTLDGEREVEIPAGAQPGEHVVLRGEGLPSLRGRNRGDEHVVLDVYVPAKLNKGERELVERLDESLGSKGSGRDGGSRWRRRATRG